MKCQCLHWYKAGKCLMCERSNRRTFHNCSYVPREHFKWAAWLGSQVNFPRHGLLSCPTCEIVKSKDIFKLILCSSTGDVLLNLPLSAWWLGSASTLKPWETGKSKNILKLLVCSSMVCWILAMNYYCFYGHEVKCSTCEMVKSKNILELSVCSWMTSWNFGHGLLVFTWTRGEVSSSPFNGWRLRK